MHVNTAIISQKIAHQDQPLVNHCDKRISTLSPSVAVGDFFQDVRLLGEGVPTNFDVHREIRPHIKGRVNVNQFETTLLFNLLAQWAVF